jgi:hypothetical protein
MADNGNPLASLYPQPPGQNSLLSNPQAVVGLVNQLNQNKLFNQTYAAKQAVGQAYQEAIRPDGTTDIPAFMSGVKSNPNAAFGAPEAGQDALSQRGQQISNASAQFGLSAGQNNLVMNSLAGLAAKPDLSYGDVQNFVATTARNTGIPSSVLNGWAQSLPRDPTALRHSLVTIGTVAAGTPGMLGRVTGAPNAEGAPTEISPAQAAFAGTSPSAVRTDAQGNALGPNGQPTNAPVSLNRQGQGTNPSQLTPVQPGVQTGVSPGQNEAQRNVGAASGAQLASDLTDSANFKRSVYPLEQAIPALERLGTSGTGPGSDTFNNVKSFIQTLGLPGVDAGKIKDYDEANKYLTDFVNQNGNTATNDKLAAAFAGNPSTKISNAASIDVAKSALALRYMKQAQVLEFQKTGLPESQYTKWSSNWVNQQDPRGYGYALMTPDAQQKLIGNLKGPDRTRFLSSLQAADRNGVIAPPQAPAQQ